MIRLVAIILLTLSATVALGQCIIRNRAAVVQTAAAVVATPAVIVPAYGASYDASAIEVQKLKEQLAAHEARLATLESALRVTQLAPPAPKPDTPPVKPIAGTSTLPAAVSRSCVKCHQAGKAKGGLALVDATGWKLATLTCEQRLEVLRRINLPDNDPAVMPPKGKGDEPVNDKEAAELLDVLTKPKGG